MTKIILNTLTPEQIDAVMDNFAVALDVQAENMARMVETLANDMQASRPEWGPKECCACIAKGLRGTKRKIN